MMGQLFDADRNDIAILGGGLAGLTFALQCRQQMPNARICVLEKNEHPVPEAAFKVGESTVEVGAHYFTKVLKLEQHIRDEQLPKLGLRFFFGAEDNRAIERRLELGSYRFAPAPSYQLDRGRFENYLAKRCLEQDISFVDGAKVRGIELRRGRNDHAVNYDRDGQSGRLQCRWVVDASGRAGIIKRQLGLAKQSPHLANAVWFRLNERIRIDDWGTQTSWREDYAGEADRWYSTNHLMGKGYWVWLIPLASGATSIGIVADEAIHPLSEFKSLEKAMEWLSRHEPQCADAIQAHMDKVMDFGAVRRYAMECQRVFSPSRWGITGEAGFFLDPFYSPGSDFIAMANTFLTDLVTRDLSGKGYRFRAFLYNRIFKKFFRGTAAVYQDQYQLFGNHQVMPVKIFWDYIIYWSLTGYLCFHDRICDQRMYIRHVFKLQKLSELNHYMQEFFRLWHHQSAAREVGGSVDISSIPLIRNTNARLLDELNNREYGRRFAENVAQVETLFWEIIDHANLDVKVPIKRRVHRGVSTDSAKVIFDATAEMQPTSQATGEYAA